MSESCTPKDLLPAMRKQVSDMIGYWMEKLDIEFTQHAVDIEQKRATLEGEYAKKALFLEERAAALDVAWSELQIARADVEADRNALEEEKRRMADGQCMTDVLRLSIGGEKTVSVKRSTLCAVEDSMLASSFSGRWDDSLLKDEDGAFFIDLDPEIFEPVLAYLRMKSIETPNNPAKLSMVTGREDEFLAILNFYGIGGASHEQWELLKFTFKNPRLPGLDVGDRGLSVRHTGLAHWKRVPGSLTFQLPTVVPMALAFQVVSFGAVESTIHGTGPCLGVAVAEFVAFNDVSDTRKAVQVWSYNSLTGHLLAPSEDCIMGRNPRAPAAAGDRIMLVLHPKGQLQLFKNDENLGIVFRGLPKSLKPIVEMKSEGSEVKIVRSESA